MTREEIIDELEEQISRCLKENSKDCKKIFHFLSNALDSIEMWKDSDDAVSRKDVHDMLINIVPFRGDSFEVWMHKACSKLAGLQSVYPKAKVGKWITDRAITRCSNCGKGYKDLYFKASIKSYNYCPNCGAKMEGVQE